VVDRAGDHARFSNPVASFVSSSAASLSPAPQPGIGMRTRAAVEQRPRAVEEEQREVEDAAGHRPPVHQHVLLPQVPPPRPHLQNFWRVVNQTQRQNPVVDFLETKAAGRNRCTLS
jgi:hypothetical protein